MEIFSMLIRTDVAWIRFFGWGIYWRVLDFESRAGGLTFKERNGHEIFCVVLFKKFLVKTLEPIKDLNGKRMY